MTERKYNRLVRKNKRQQLKEEKRLQIYKMEKIEKRILKGCNDCSFFGFTFVKSDEEWMTEYLNRKYPFLVFDFEYYCIPERPVDKYSMLKELSWERKEKR